MTNLHVMRLVRSLSDKDLIDIALHLANKHPDTFIALREDVEKPQPYIFWEGKDGNFSLNENQMNEVVCLYGNGDGYVNAIRYVRNQVECTLRDAKDFLDFRFHR